MRKNKIIISLVFIFIVFVRLSFAGKSAIKKAYNGNTDPVKTLLKNKSNTDKRNSFGGTALRTAMLLKKILG